MSKTELGNFRISTRAQIEDQKKLSFSSSQERKRLFPESGKFVFVWIFISFGGSRDEDRFADVSVGDVGGMLIDFRTGRHRHFNLLSHTDALLFGPSGNFFDRILAKRGRHHSQTT